MGHSWVTRSEGLCECFVSRVLCLERYASSSSRPMTSPPIRPSDESVPHYLSGEGTGVATCCRKRLTGAGTGVITGEEVGTIRLLRGVGTR
jgi:hypothetical protein